MCFIYNIKSGFEIIEIEATRLCQWYLLVLSLLEIWLCSFDSILYSKGYMIKLFVTYLKVGFQL
jgi:hypothetical protein